MDQPGPRPGAAGETVPGDCGHPELILPHQWDAASAALWLAWAYFQRSTRWVVSAGNADIASRNTPQPRRQAIIPGHLRWLFLLPALKSDITRALKVQHL